MNTIGACEDLRAEALALRILVQDHSSVDGLEVTPFHRWRVRDTIGHLVVIDRLADLTLSDPAAFEAESARFGEGTAGGVADGLPDGVFQRIATYERSRLDLLNWAQLLAAWDAGLTALCETASVLDGDEKVNWFGAEIRIRTLINARQMEVWAYGQDVFDLYRTPRTETDRLRNVADFAVRTLGFSFANRGLAVPEVRPFVALSAPSGAVWTWNAAANGSRIEGRAADFCLVASQRRHVTDTGLKVSGDDAETWMRIAQCIAGPPLDGPEPGERQPPG